jgi:excisionase family DNA binding protein
MLLRLRRIAGAGAIRLTFHYDVVIVEPMELTTAQAAARLGISQGRVRQLVLAGRIKARHLTARMLLIDARELEKVKHRPPGRRIKGR